MVQINKNFLQWQIKKYLEFSADSITCQSINYSSRSFPISILLSTVCNSQCVTYCYEDPILYSLQYFVFLSWCKEKYQKSSMRVLLKLLFEQLCYISRRLKFWVVDQQGQSYHMARWCLINLHQATL